MSCKEHISVAVAGISFSSIGTHGGGSARDVPMALMGPTLKRGEFIQDTIPGLEDIIPTIYDRWGDSIPSYMDGEVMTDVLA